MSRVTEYTQSWLSSCTKTSSDQLPFLNHFLVFLGVAHAEAPEEGWLLNVHTVVSGRYAIRYRRFYTSRHFGSSGTVTQFRDSLVTHFAFGFHSDALLFR